ncbi:MHO_1590 family protein [Mycoplasmopsis columbinasalis]|uniref:Membrane protein n=1 Tax=Mycoplasmopsis columbinasalis TaxID=114880 RepID=A0A449BA26_9BACT|nr:hypothetical protein [Mycoplasmopsis columbinasalis]VEU78049.1 membrane protein [Mycoplasmopsis columbinasalis]
MTLKNKILIGVGSVAGIAAIATPVALVSAKKTKKEHLASHLTANVHDQNAIFPKISGSEFYDYIVIDKGQPIFKPIIVPKLIQYIVTNTEASTGKLYFDYKFVDSKRLIIYLKWVGEQEALTKKYLLKILNSEILIKDGNEITSETEDKFNEWNNDGTIDQSDSNLQENDSDATV